MNARHAPIDQTAQRLEPQRIGPFARRDDAGRSRVVLSGGIPGRDRRLRVGLSQHRAQACQFLERGVVPDMLVGVERYGLSLDFDLDG